MAVAVVVDEVGLMDLGPCRQGLGEVLLEVLGLFLIALTHRLPKVIEHGLLEEHGVGVGVVRVDQSLFPGVVAVETKLLGKEDVDRDTLGQL